jgi:hypothetical protein
MKPCTVCNQWMPKDATRCNACQSFQDHRRYVPTLTSVLPLLTAFASVCALALNQLTDYVNRNSSTSVIVARADANLLYVRASNTGRASSTLRRYTLDFGTKVPVETAPLELYGDDKLTSENVVAGGGQVNIRLLARGFTPRLRPDGTGRFSPEEIKNALDVNQVTLSVDVQESNGLTPRTDIVDGSAVQKLVMNRLDRSSGQ